jgi:hypothetical protein
MIILDLIFTKVYVNTSVIRNKIQYVFKNKNKEFDYVFLGSSRVEYHINTNLIDSITLKNSLNLGVSGQSLPETFLMLKLLKDNNIKTNNIFLQIDEAALRSSAKEKRKLLGSSYFMPYINSSNSVKNHMKTYDVNYTYDAYFPFYKYIKYNPKIGYRELLLTLSGKKRADNFFIGLNKRFDKKTETYQFVKKYNNSILNKIKKYSKENNIQLNFYTSPYYNPKNDEEFDVFCKKNNIINYSEAIKKIKYFKDLTHLNDKGAHKFTLLIIKDFDL